ncbi:nucleoporin-interacting protein [Paenibacillus sp. HJGM_3]|uniref:nucleoporin-interacting protein n=1 Tax=Paenibacillus sp. HJGM_3 TaxID=3379816 RepID=UPI00385F9892
MSVALEENSSPNKHRYARIVALVTVLFALAVILSAAAISLYYASPMPRTWDEVDFVLALDRYDLLAMQPHFPGYPYFILGGWLAHQGIANPAQALSVFNTVAGLSAAVPMALLARRLTQSEGGAAASLLLPALVLTSPYVWLMASRPMSEAAGLAALWWFLWSVRRAMDRPESLRRHFWPLFLFSGLMGIRLSFFPFGLLLLPLWLGLWQRNRKRSHRGWKLLLSLAMAMLLQLVWVAGLVLSEGTLFGFWKLAMAFVEGHFSEWGGGVVSIPMSLHERIIRLFAHNLAGSALLCGSVWVGCLFVCLLALLIGAVLTKRSGSGARGAEPSPSAHEGQSHQINRHYWIWLAASVLLYGLWALLGQNIEKPRHIVPVVAPILLAVHVFTVRTAQAISHGRTQKLAAALYAALAVLIAAQWLYGAPLQKRQAVEEPAVYQLHRYVDAMQQPLILFTWEETRLLQYVGATYEHRRIYTFGYFQALANADPHRTVLLTDHVLKGFEQEGKSVGEHVRKIAEFHSDPRFEPVYGNIALYEWIR